MLLREMFADETPLAPSCVYDGLYASVQYRSDALSLRADVRTSLSCGARLMRNKVPFMPSLDQSVEGVRPDRRIVVAALGVTQILAWGSTFYLLGVLANPIARDTGWSYDWAVSGVSVGLLMAGSISPRLAPPLNID